MLNVNVPPFYVIHPKTIVPVFSNWVKQFFIFNFNLNLLIIVNQFLVFAVDNSSAEHTLKFCFLTFMKKVPSKNS